jgi:hypothetical protein
MMEATGIGEVTATEAAADAMAAAAQVLADEKYARAMLRSLLPLLTAPLTTGGEWQVDKEVIEAMDAARIAAARRAIRILEADLA